MSPWLPLLHLERERERERETPNDTKERGALGPLHTRAKSRDHEIVRAQKKVAKGCPNSPPSVVTDPQV
jgi:hypothetical protein